MTTPTDAQHFTWIAEKISQEEAHGPVVPGGAQGGAIARARRTAENARRSQVPAALRARARVRRAFQPLEVDEAA